MLRSFSFARFSCRAFAYLLLVGMLLSLCGCDTSWQEKAVQAFRDGVEADDDGDFDKARKLYRKALELDPYYQDANRKLAELLESRFLDEGLAIVYYRRYLGLEPDDAEQVELVEAKIDALKRIHFGVIEDPINATKDLMWSITQVSLRNWLERLHVNMITQTLVLKKTTAEKFLLSWNKEIGESTNKFLRREIFMNNGSKSAGSRAIVIVEVTPKGGGKTKYWRFTWELPKNSSKGRLWELYGISLLRGTGPF